MIKEIGERARWSTYFALDKVRGGAVRTRFEKDLHAWKYGTSVRDEEDRIRALLRHAAETTAFYRNCDPEAPLETWPIVNKDTWRTHYEEFRSSAYPDGTPGMRLMTTSGSTGTPFTMVQDAHKVVCNTADSIFLSALGGYRIGDRIAFIRVWVDNVKKSRLQLFMENSIMMESSSLSDEAIRGMLDVIRRKGIRVITGYASALGEISRYIDRTGMDLSGFRVQAILPISESMPSPVRERLSAQFGCPVRSYYSNEENGIMGIENRRNESYYINSESYHYEILNMESNEAVPDGTVGRIVITDLTNYAFPVIRYDNGDSASARRTVRGDRYRLVLESLYGRRSDMLYDTSGAAVTPYVVTNNLWDVEGVRQYQFLQTGEKEYELRLNGDRGVMDVENMLGRIRPALGEDALIRVTYVDEIPVLASGKRKYIENLWRK